MFCRTQTLVKHTADQEAATTLTCRSWYCPNCSPERKKQLIAIALDGKPDTFLTLTVHPKPDETPATRAARLSWAWRLVRKRIRRYYGYTRLPFFAVFERTKRGEPHLHILLRVKWIDHGWLSQQMKALIDAPIVHIERITDQRKAAYYVAKYTSKDPFKFATTKRYWRSPDYCLTSHVDSNTVDGVRLVYEVCNYPLNKWTERATSYGYTIETRGRWLFARYGPTADSV